MEKINLQLLTGKPWLATFRAPPWLMLGGIPSSITLSGVDMDVLLKFTLEEDKNMWITHKEHDGCWHPDLVT